jgi:solute carrier family 35, member E1
MRFLQQRVFPLAALHTTSHISAVIGLGAGAIGFVHIVKAAEPIFTALFSALLLKQYLPLPVILSLLPVVGGVAVASIKVSTLC